jgi:ABC-type branched-subunit amino acid transport system ATPase component
MIRIDLNGPAPIVELDDVSKSFSGVRALRNISFSAKGTGVVGLIGPNGSGKSTLLGIMSGLIQPTAGRYSIDGRSAHGLSADVLAQSGVSRSFQHSRLVPDLRCWENVAVGYRRRVSASGFGWRKERNRALEAMARMGILDIADAWPTDVTAAQGRKIEIARTLAAQPRVVLLDEPAAGLSEFDARELVDVVADASRTAMVILVEHNLHIVRAVAKLVIVLVNGALEATGSPDEVTESPLVRKAYLGVE